MAGSAQKFTTGKASPRVHTEYRLGLYDATKPVQMPFVLGVLGDLAGAAQIDARSIEERDFFEINVDDFDALKKGPALRRRIDVRDGQAGEGSIAIELAYETQADFVPDAIAARAAALRPLLEGRSEYRDLIAYMERSPADTAPEVHTQASALDALRSIKLPEPEEDTSGSVLDSLRSATVPDTPEVDESAVALDALRNVEIEETQRQDGTATLDALRDIEGPALDEDDSATEALDALRAVEIAPEAETNTAASALEELRKHEVVEETSEESGAALDALRAVEIEDVSEDDSAETLDALRVADLPEPERTDTSAEILASLPDADLPEQETDQAEAILAGIEAVEVVEEEDRSEAVLAGIEAIEDAPEVDEVAEALSGLEAPEEVEGDSADDILSAMEAIEVQPETGDLEDVLAGLEAPEVEDVTDDLDAILSDLDAPVIEDEGEAADDILAAIEAVDDVEPDDTSDAILAGIEGVEDEPEADDLEDLLAGIEAPAEVEETDDLDAILSDLDAPVLDEETDTADDILAGIDIVETPPESDDIEDVLDGLEAPEEMAEEDDLDAVLSGLDAPDTVEDDGTDLDDILAGLPDEPAAAEVAGEADELDSILADPDRSENADADELDALLDDIGEVTAEEAEDDDLEDLLADAAPETDAAGDDAEDVLDIDVAENEEASEPEEPAEIEQDILDAPAAYTAEEDPAQDDVLSEEEQQAEREMAELLADLQPDEPDQEDDDLDALLGALEDEPDEEPAPEPEALDDLDALLAGLQDDTPEDEDATAQNGDASAEDSDSEIDAQLIGLDDVADEKAPDEETPDENEIDTLLADLEEDPATAEDDMDALLALLDADETEGEGTTAGAADEGTMDMPDEIADTSAKATLSAEPELAYGTMSGDRPDAQKLERKRFRIAILGDFTGRSAHGQIEVGDALASRKPILLDPDTVEDVIEGFATTLVLPIGKDGAGVEVKLGGLDDLHPDELYENVELFAALKSLKSQLSNGGTADNAAKSLVAWGEQHGRAVAPARATSGGNTVRADLKLSDFQKLIGDTERTLAQPSPVDELMARVVGPHIRKLPDPDVTAMAGAVDDALSGAMRMVLHHPEFQSVEAQWRAIDLIARSIETDDTLEVMLYDISAEEFAADLTQSDDLSTSGFVRLLTEGPMDEEFGRGAYSALMGMYTFEETPPHAQLLGRIARVAAHVDAPFFAAITPGFIETAKQDRHPLVAAEWDTLRAMPEAGHLALATPRFLMRRPYGAKTEPIYEFDFEEFTQSAGLSGMLWANPVVLVAILLAKSFKENGPSMGLGQIMSLGDMPYHFVLDRFGDQVALPCTERNLTLDKVETVLGRGYLPVVSIKGRDEIRLASFQSLGGGEILGPWSGVKPPPPSAPKPPKAVPDAVDGNDNDAAGDDDDLDDLLSGFDLDAGDNDEDIDNDEDMDAELAALLADL